MIERVRDRILQALTRLERPDPDQTIYAGTSLNRAFGVNGFSFTVMEPAGLIVDMNIWMEKEFSPYVSTMVSLGGCNMYSYADGMLLAVPAGRAIPKPEHAYLDHTEMELPVLMIGHVDPVWKTRIDPENIVVRMSTEEENLFSGTLYNAFLDTYQREPIILLRNLKYYRLKDDPVVLGTVEQVQLIYTTALSSASRIGPVKTNLDLTAVGLPNKRQRRYIQAFTWNGTRAHNESPMTISYLGSNGMHFFQADNDTEPMRAFVRWVSEIDLRTDRAGWFADPADEVRALGLLSAL
jgi:hypothetical protein